MKFYLFTLLFLLHAVPVELSGNEVCTAKWDYRRTGRTGPRYWSQISPTCGGRKQSPIDIDVRFAHPAHESNVVRMHNYHKYGWQSYVLKNNGHALQMDLPANNKYKILKGDTWWIPLQVHIHFGNASINGSEHSLCHDKYVAEVHMVHRNAKYNVPKAKTMPDGLMVIGSFVEMSRRGECSPGIKQMAAMASKVINPHKNMQVKLRPFPLKDFLPTENTFPYTYFNYVNYKGSLTTPPCTENVDWIVNVRNTLRINAKTLSQLNALKDCHGGLMAGNFRPVQNRNNRPIFAVV